MSRFCDCAAHAQDNNNNYLYIRAMGRHGFPGIPRRFGMRLPLGCNGLREASALIRISSYILYTAKTMNT